jgi:arsenate reductase
MHPEDIRAESAGSDPASAIWPGVIEAMNEVGIDLSGRKPRKLLREMQAHADWAVTMGCGDACPYVPTTVESWDLPDPANLPVEEVRPIRDAIEAHVRELVDTKLDAIRSDRTAHQIRRIQLLPSLAREFGPALGRRGSRLRRCRSFQLRRRPSPKPHHDPRPPPHPRMPGRRPLPRAGRGLTWTAA